MTQPAAPPNRRSRTILAAVVGFVLLAVAVVLVFTPARPAASGKTVAVPASVRYRQNTTPDYLNFAYAYGSLLGAPDYAITANLTLSRTMADRLCGELRSGLSEDDLVARLTGSGSGQFVLTAADARGVVDSLRIFICSGK